MPGSDRIKELENQIFDLKIRVKRLEAFIRDFPNPEGYLGYEPDPTEDEELQEAIEIIRHFNQASASFLQRKMSIGYSRAARLLDQLEELKLVGPANGSESREVLSENISEFMKREK